MTNVSDFGQAQGVQVIARLDSPTYRPLQRLGLTVDITIDTGLHVYGQPIPEGFIPVSIDIASLAGLVVGTPEFPAPTLHRLEGLEENFYIYEGTLTVTIPLTFSQAVADPIISLTVGYQACSDEAGCFMPQKIQLRLPVQAEDHTG